MELLVQRRMLLLLEADGEDCPKVAEMTSWLGAPTLLCCLARCMALRQQSKALVLQMYPAASLVHLLACGSSDLMIEKLRHLHGAVHCAGVDLNSSARCDTVPALSCMVCWWAACCKSL